MAVRAARLVLVLADPVQVSARSWCPLLVWC